MTLKSPVKIGVKKESKSFLVPLAPMETGVIDSNTELKAKAVEFGAELTK